MIPCPTCSRFIRSGLRRCPFCESTLRSVPSPVGPTVAGVLLGLALTACGGDSTGEDGASASMSANGTASGTANDSTGSTTNGVTSTTMGSGSVGTSTTTDIPPGESSVAAYAGPGTDTFDDETADTGTTGTGTSTGSGSGSESTGTSGE